MNNGELSYFYHPAINTGSIEDFILLLVYNASNTLFQKCFRHCLQNYQAWFLLCCHFSRSFSREHLRPLVPSLQKNIKLSLVFACTALYGLVLTLMRNAMLRPYSPRTLSQYNLYFDLFKSLCLFKTLKTYWLLYRHIKPFVIYFLSSICTHLLFQILFHQTKKQHVTYCRLVMTLVIRTQTLSEHRAANICQMSGIITIPIKTKLLML